MNTRAMLALIASAGIVGISPLPSLAHGKPAHGGAFTEVREYTFEVVSNEQEEEKEERAEKEKKTTYGENGIHGLR